MIAQPTAQEATEVLTPFYELDAKQVTRMVTIQQQRINNLEAIQPLLQTDYYTYLAKRRNIERNTLESIERMLRGEQLETIRQQRIRIRKHESDIIRTLRRQGKTNEQIEMAIAEADYRGIE